MQVGRSSQAAITLGQASVSRRHLELTWDGTDWQVTDLSTHGSYDLRGLRQPETWRVGRDIELRLGGTEGVPVGFRVLACGIPEPARADEPIAPVVEQVADR
ncbi:MAG: FHA domain-containing protein, partial [Actinomycetota bacterium]